MASEPGLQQQTWGHEAARSYYNAYHAHGQDWEKVAAACGKPPAACEALFQATSTFLALPPAPQLEEAYVAMVKDFERRALLVKEETDPDRADSPSGSRRGAEAASGKGQQQQQRVQSSAVGGAVDDDKSAAAGQTGAAAARGASRAAGRAGGGGAASGQEEEGETDVKTEEGGDLYLREEGGRGDHGNDEDGVEEDILGGSRTGRPVRSTRGQPPARTRSPDATPRTGILNKNSFASPASSRSARPQGRGMQAELDSARKKRKGAFADGMGGELDEGVDALMQLALASEAANGNEEASHHVSTRGGGRGAARGVAEDYEEWEGEDEGVYPQSGLDRPGKRRVRPPARLEDQMPSPLRNQSVGTPSKRSRMAAGGSMPGSTAKTPLRNGSSSGAFAMGSPGLRMGGKGGTPRSARGRRDREAFGDGEEGEGEGGDGNEQGEDGEDLEQGGLLGAMGLPLSVAPVRTSLTASGLGADGYVPGSAQRSGRHRTPSARAVSAQQQQQDESLAAAFAGLENLMGPDGKPLVDPAMWSVLNNMGTLPMANFGAIDGGFMYGMDTTGTRGKGQQFDTPDLLMSATRQKRRRKSIPDRIPPLVMTPLNTALPPVALPPPAGAPAPQQQATAQPTSSQQQPTSSQQPQQQPGDGAQEQQQQQQQEGGPVGEAQQLATPAQGLNQSAGPAAEVGFLSMDNSQGKLLAELGGDSNSGWPPPSLQGSEGAGAAAAAVQRRGCPEAVFVNALASGRVRRWIVYEFFYSAIDRPWFMRNELQELLALLGLSSVAGLTRAEWSLLRGSFGRPRRLSLSFLKEERTKLESFREGVRAKYEEVGLGGEVPPEIPRPLYVGQEVCARHPATRQLHDGVILTVKGIKYRVQFHRTELQTEVVEDTDVMPVNPGENLPLAMLALGRPFLLNGRLAGAGPNSVASLTAAARAVALRQELANNMTRVAAAAVAAAAANGGASTGAGAAGASANGGAGVSTPTAGDGAAAGGAAAGQAPIHPALPPLRLPLPPTPATAPIAPAPPSTVITTGTPTANGAPAAGGALSTPKASQPGLPAPPPALHLIPGTAPAPGTSGTSLLSGAAALTAGAMLPVVDGEPEAALLAEVSAKLDAKDALVARLEALNDEASAGTARTPSGEHTEAFQLEYTRVVLQLKELNLQLESLMQQLQARSTAAAGTMLQSNAGIASISAATGGQDAQRARVAAGFGLPGLQGGLVGQSGAGGLPALAFGLLGGQGLGVGNPAGLAGLLGPAGVPGAGLLGGPLGSLPPLGPELGSIASSAIPDGLHLPTASSATADAEQVSYLLQGAYSDAAGLVEKCRGPAAAANARALAPTPAQLALLQQHVFDSQKRQSTAAARPLLPQLQQGMKQEQEQQQPGGVPIKLEATADRALGPTTAATGSTQGDLAPAGPEAPTSAPGPGPSRDPGPSAAQPNGPSDSTTGAAGKMEGGGGAGAAAATTPVAAPAGVDALVTRCMALLCTLQRVTSDAVPVNLVDAALEGALRALWLHHPLVPLEPGTSSSNGAAGDARHSQSPPDNGTGSQQGQGILPAVPTALGPNTALYRQIAESVRALKAQLARA